MLDWTDYHTIAVVSDTHLPDEGELAPSLLEALDAADAIIHLGDFNNAETYDFLAGKGPLAAVFGNLDDDTLCTTLPEKQTIRVGNHTLGIVHGWGPPVRLEKRVRTVFPAIDMILFGHSHIPGVFTLGETLLLNPGSATCNRDGSRTFARLTINSSIHHEIITLNDYAIPV